MLEEHRDHEEDNWNDKLNDEKLVTSQSEESFLQCHGSNLVLDERNSLQKVIFTDEH